jgi:hypothetical protein
MVRSMYTEHLSEAELGELDALARAASPGPWRAFAGPGIGGPAFISLSNDDAMPDMYVQHDDKPAPDADLDFIAAARNYVPRLLTEIRKQRGR